MVNEESRVIFDLDIACPVCAYNLRRVTQYRCPECGTPFDTQELLETHFARTPQSLWRTINKVCRHPITFWDSPEIRLGQVPAMRHILAFPAIGIILAAVVHVASLALTRGVQIPLADFFSALGIMLLLLFGFLFWGLIHLALCSIAFRKLNRRENIRKTEAIVGYSAFWLIIAIPCWYGLMAWPSWIAFSSKSVIWAFPAGVVCFVGLAISLCCWSISLYCGGVAKSNGNRLVGIWCTISNPLLYPVVVSILQILM